ncbi:hypothetical protein CBR_g31683 [Chara braunii]|uniref:RNA polymerase III subunit Rpc25 domain-containing protein n=1 Tax=Chara braunii TaxID=69332 RepID=A0A388JXW3_CHABU|nr:hypothetical protein CBR_g31683 [Chara braunii]|eukprot:GBG62664.1 hypothetical protein CBR_g31683 [Chara braunii]
MFRPFVGEILIGKLKHCDETGLFSNFCLRCLLGSTLFVVRFRVADVKYPPIPIEHERNAKPFAPMQIVGDVNADGLGLLSWWS